MSLKKWFINYISSKIEENQEILKDEDVLLEEDSQLENIQNYINIANRYIELLNQGANEENLNNLALTLIEIEKLLYADKKLLICVTDNKSYYYPENDFAIKIEESIFYRNLIIRQLYLKQNSFIFVDYLEQNSFKNFLQISNNNFILDFFDNKTNINILFGKSDLEIIEIFNEVYQSEFMNNLITLILQSTTFLEKLKYFNDDDNYAEIIKDLIINYPNRDTSKTTTKDLLDIPLKQILIEDIEFIKPFERKLISIREIVYFFKKENLQDLIELVKTCPLPLGIQNSNKEKIREIFKLQVKIYKNFDKILKEWDLKEENKLLNLFSGFAFGYLGDLFCNYRINPTYFIEDANIIIKAIPITFSHLAKINAKFLSKSIDANDRFIIDYGLKTFEKKSISFLQENKNNDKIFFINKNILFLLNEEKEEVVYIPMEEKEKQTQSFENQYIYQVFEKINRNLKRVLSND